MVIIYRVDGVRPGSTPGEEECMNMCEREGLAESADRRNTEGLLFKNTD